MPGMGKGNMDLTSQRGSRRSIGTWREYQQDNASDFISLHGSEEVTSCGLADDGRREEIVRRMCTHLAPSFLTPRRVSPESQYQYSDNYVILLVIVHM